MATITQIRPMLNDMTDAERLVFITKYTGERQLDMDKANHYVREAVKKEKKVAEKRAVPKPTKATMLGLNDTQRALLAKLGMKI